jgi:hypothetical protein
MYYNPAVSSRAATISVERASGLRGALWAAASSPAFFECRLAQTRIWLRLCCSVGQTIVFRRLLGWAAGPQNLMKNVAHALT